MHFSKKEWEEFKKSGFQIPHYYADDDGNITSMIKMNGFGGMATNNGSMSSMNLIEFKDGKRFSHRFELAETRELPAERSDEESKSYEDVFIAIEEVLKEENDKKEYDAYEADKTAELVKVFSWDSLDCVEFIMAVEEHCKLEIKDEHHEVLIGPFTNVYSFVNKLIELYPEVSE